MSQSRTKLLLLALLFIFGKSLTAQDPYWIFFTDKKDVKFNPYEYFDAKAIARRIKNEVPINDPTDWPLNTNYVNTVSQMVDSVSGLTRWFNALAVMATKDQITKIQKLSFVKKVEAMEYYAVAAKKEDYYSDDDQSNLRNEQLDILGRQDFNKAGIDGKGVRIAIFDGGFPGVNTMSAFKIIRDEKRLIDTWDFTKNKAFVFYSISHGSEVMSNIVGLQINNSGMTSQFGLATGAEILLAKTEVKREPFSEEKNWLMAVEWADKMGADIINSSLGYTKDRYFRSDMNGQQSLVTRAGNMAARKGILVVNAAGNDGENTWHIIGAPADADSVLSVGGIDPEQHFHISFSSYGPTADGRMKPNVCAFGSTIVSDPDDYAINVQGTSFASPLIAGFAACALQANPNMKVMDLFHLIEKSGHLYPYFDYAHGYGVPQAKYVLTKKREKVEKTFEAEVKNNRLSFNILDSSINQIGGSQLMYVSFQKKDGTLSNYKVIEVHQKKFSIDIEFDIDTYSEDILKVIIYYNHYIQEIQL